MTHTPGPWTFEVEAKGNGEGAKFWLTSADGVAVIGGCGCCDSPFMEGNYQADAVLIAAAPELLEALESMCSAYVNLLEAGRSRIIALGGDCDPVDRMEQDDPHLRAARTAIKKAKFAS